MPRRRSGDLPGTPEGRVADAQEATAARAEKAKEKVSVWDSIARRHGMDLSGGANPFLRQVFTDSVMQGHEGLPVGDLISGRHLGALRAAVGLSPTRLGQRLGMTSAYLAAVEAGERPLAPECLKDGARSLEELRRLVGAIESFLQFRQSLGLPIEVVIPPTTEEVAAEEAERERQAFEDNPWLVDQRIAEAAHDPSHSQFVHVAVSTNRGAWSNNGDANARFLEHFNPGVVKDLLAELLAMHRRLEEYEGKAA